MIASLATTAPSRRPRLRLAHHGAHRRPGRPGQRRDHCRIPCRRPGLGLSTRGRLRLPRRDRPARPRRQRQQRHCHTDNQLLPPLPAPPRRRADAASRLRPRRPPPVRRALRAPCHRLPRRPTARHRYPGVTSFRDEHGPPPGPEPDKTSPAGVLSRSAVTLRIPSDRAGRHSRTCSAIGHPAPASWGLQPCSARWPQDTTRRDPRDERPTEHRSHPRRMGRGLLLERRHRALAGRRLPCHRAAVPADRAGR